MLDNGDRKDAGSWRHYRYWTLETGRFPDTRNTTDVESLRQNGCPVSSALISSIWEMRLFNNISRSIVEKHKLINSILKHFMEHEYHGKFDLLTD